MRDYDDDKQGEMPEILESDPSLDLRRTDYVDWTDIDFSGMYEDQD